MFLPGTRQSVLRQFIPRLTRSPPLSDREQNARNRNSVFPLTYWHDSRGERQPVLLVPILVGVPIVVGGGWVIYKIVGG